ncbi:MAG: alpha/beta hydrolase [Eubacterium sp.]|nr:alpha/beta hydrolase [Eubacterium sp.]
MYREDMRSKLYDLLGDLPDRNIPVNSKLIAREERDEYTVESLILELNNIESVPAYFISPKTVNKPNPVILYNHSHGGNYSTGKEEIFTGAQYLHNISYARELTQCGYSVLCIDEWGFGERRGRTETEIFKEMLWKGQVMWGMMVYDSIRAVDYLLTRQDVDTGRIATVGMSMGGNKSWWLSALDERIKVCVDICSMTEFQELINCRSLDKHGIYYYVPGLLKHFSTAGINSLICPRPHLSINGIYDRITSQSGLNIIDDELKRIYKEDNNSCCYEMKRYSAGHFETHDMRKSVLDFLKKWL